MTLNATDQKCLDAAVRQAHLGWDEGGVPIGAVLATGEKILGEGRNRRVQQNSAIRHGETDCLENIGRMPAKEYANTTMYTTLSPCPMCTGAILLYKIPRVVIGENRTFMGAEDTLRAAGVEVIVADDSRCIELMEKMKTERPVIWAEDIGEDA